MPDIELIKEKVKEQLYKINAAHDFSHTERVLKLALHIGKVENADLEILELASLLHDIARKCQDESNGKICHAEKGAEMAKEILKEQGYSQEKIEKIANCILTHRYRNNKKPETKEAEILYDADKLDAIGAIGLARAFMFAENIGAELHNENANLSPEAEYTKDDTAYREFLVKLSKVKDKMFTNEGKKLAEERHEFMQQFFNRLNKELKGEI